VLCPRRPSSTLFPYTTLFRSPVLRAQFPPRARAAAALAATGGVGGGGAGGAAHRRRADAATVAAAGASAAHSRGRDRRGECAALDRKSTRLNSSHSQISYAVF